MISVLIPWRSNDPHRIAAWNYTRPRWEALDVQLCVSDDGRDTGPFSVARAINRARASASGDALAVFGADHIPPDPARLRWIADRLSVHPWTAVYAGTRVINPWGTQRVYDGMPPADAVRLRSAHIGMCMGIVAARAEVWDDVGGFDERFEGWGAEDAAFLVALRALYPDGRADGEGDAWALWHAEEPREELTRANIARCDEYEAAARAGQMREFLEGRRGHALDQPGT